MKQRRKTKVSAENKDELQKTPGAAAWKLNLQMRLELALKHW